MTFQQIADSTGALGESIFAKHIIDKGYLVYRLQNGFSCPRCNFHGWGVGRYHPFDMFVCKPYKPPNFDFSDCFYAEVKTKTRSHPLNDKYNEIGFNLSDWAVYKAIAAQTKIPFWVIFVDRTEIYGAEMSTLAKRLEIDGRVYPREYNFGEKRVSDVVDKHVVFFSKTVMSSMGKLTFDEQKKLQNVTRQQSTLSLPRVDARAEFGFADR